MIEFQNYSYHVEEEKLVAGVVAKAVFDMMEIEFPVRIGVLPLFGI